MVFHYLYRFNPLISMARRYKLIIHFVTSIVIFSGKEAETAFRNLRNRYSRDKKKIKNAKVSGTGTDSVTDAKRETSELFLYLEWLEPYIQPRSSTSNLVVINDDSDITADSTDKDDDCDRSSNSAEPDNKVMLKSQVTSRTKYSKRNRAKDDVDSAELEFLQTIGDRLKEKPTPPQRDEESIFGDLIASQLRQLPYHERVMAKMEISNVVYSRLLRKNCTNPAYLAGGFQTQEQRSHDMPQVYSQTNVREATPPPAPAFAVTDMQSADHHVFPQGYFFQLRQSEN